MPEDGIDQASGKAIWSYFHSTERRIFKTRELRKIISTRRFEWGVPRSVSFDAIVQHAALKKIRLAFPNRAEIRYCFDAVSVYELALSLTPKSYLTHHTALYLHELIDDEPNDVYVNSEQSVKPRWDTELDQQSIDRAFQRPVRTTSNIATYDKWRICQVSGKQTGALGVVSKQLPGELSVQTTGIERTLVDAVVRPIYCGGISTVQACFRKAKGKLSARLLKKTLQELDYLYPYHQSIGFLLERAGVFSESEIKAFLQMPKTYDFYLEHHMEDPQYSSRWRLHYPRMLDG
jgi:predicted transcriptional regulator of viral defense system